MYPEQNSQEKTNQSESSKEFVDLKKTYSSTSNSHKIHSKNNPVQQSTSSVNHSFLQASSKDRKIIKVSTSKNSYLTFMLNSKEEQDSLKLTAFKNNHEFFKDQNIKHLIESLVNQKKTKSPKKKKLKPITKETIKVPDIIETLPNNCIKMFKDFKVLKSILLPFSSVFGIASTVKASATTS